MNQPSDLLSHAGDFLRTTPEPGWDAIAARVIAAVRAAPRSGGWPLLANVPERAGQGRVYISENVVRSTLAVTLRQRYLCAPTSIEFDIDDGALRAVHIDVTGSYGAELHELGDRIRATAAQTVTELLGAATTNRGPIDITISNIVTGDPLHS
jgi:hypothetical protein